MDTKYKAYATYRSCGSGELVLAVGEDAAIYASIFGRPLSRCTISSEPSELVEMLRSGAGKVFILPATGGTISLGWTLSASLSLVWTDTLGTHDVVTSKSGFSSGLLALFTKAAGLSDGQLLLADQMGWHIVTRQPGGHCNLFEAFDNNDYLSVKRRQSQLTMVVYEGALKYGPCSTDMVVLGGAAHNHVMDWLTEEVLA